MYSYVVSQIPNYVANQVIDLLEPIPTENPYEKLKNTIIARMTKLHERRLCNQLSKVKLGNRSPSQLLCEMRQMVGRCKIENATLRHMWIRCLPSKVIDLLAVQSPEKPLDEMAQIADVLYDFLYGGPSQQTTKSRAEESQSEMKEPMSKFLQYLEEMFKGHLRQRACSSHPEKPGKLCWYHRCHGDRARLCKAPCSQYEAFKSLVANGSFSSRGNGTGPAPSFKSRRASSASRNGKVLRSMVRFAES
uniref:DUF7041 domain-containing protein n=1 Tax=Mesocestoides corti TaxID=53468 RepID=A0A5K3FVU3_MESCO